MKRWFLRLLVVVVIAAAVGAAVALNDQKRRMAEMSDDELRAYLGRKLEGRVPPEKLEQIQDKVTAAVRSGRSEVGSPPLSSNGDTAATDGDEVAAEPEAAADDAASDDTESEAADAVEGDETA